MKFGILFFCITCFYCLNSEKLLLAEEMINKNTMVDEMAVLDKMTNKETMADEMAILAENIYGLLLCRRSPDEIAVILADKKEHVNAIQKLAIRMADLQNKQYSKDSIINLVITNEEKEKYYANENFWLTMENCYFVLKIIVILVVVIVLLYLLYRYMLSYFFPSLDGQSPEKTGSPPSVQKPTESNPPVNNNLPHDTQAHGTTNQSNQETITHEGKTTSQSHQGLPESNSPVDGNLPHDTQAHETSNQSNQATMTHEGKTTSQPNQGLPESNSPVNNNLPHDQAHGTSNQSDQEAFTTDYLKQLISKDIIDERLIEEVLEQNNYLKRFIGVAQVPFIESLVNNRKLLENVIMEHEIKTMEYGLICLERIAKQIAYARSIGLEPEKINTLGVNAGQPPY
jgi:hypothetical protein